METNYHSLLKEFTTTKKELGEAENTIRRLTGRDPDDVANGSSKFRTRGRETSTNYIYSARKRSLNMSTGYDRKRPKIEYISHTSDEYTSDEGDKKKERPTLQSTIIAKHNQPRSRKATIADLNSNATIKDRNKRMFGALLLGTLQKFGKEEEKRKLKESMKASIDKKVEDANAQEKERLKHEKESLFTTRREKKVKLRILEKKIERAESHDVFESNYKNITNSSFIMTKAEPVLFYAPTSHTSASRKCLADTKTKINELMDKQNDKYKLDLNEIEELYKKDSVSSFKGKESDGAKEEVESQDVPETESEALVVEQEDSNPEEDESTNYRSLGSSLIDQEFEPIYD